MQTRSPASVCVAGEGLSRGCVCRDKIPDNEAHERASNTRQKSPGGPFRHGVGRTWRVAGCVGAGLRGSAAGGGIAGVMPEVGREGRGCLGTGWRAED